VSCHHISYRNPEILAACILYDRNRVLWIKRACNPYAGCWAVPAGFIESGETVREAACRELYEETRIRLVPERLRLYGVFSIPGIDQVYVSMIAPLPSQRFEVTSEALDIKLLSATELNGYALAYPEATNPLIHELYAYLDSALASSPPCILEDVRIPKNRLTNTWQVSTVDIGCLARKGN
jgi:ADP-ribose pyrophosphatase YjhB (NUDIX family)